MSENRIKSRTIQVLLGITGTIFLGAIGSGLWDVFLRHVFTYITDSFLSLVSVLFRGYLDTLYSQVSRNPSTWFSKIPYLLVMISVLTLPWFVVWSLLRRTQKMTEQLNGIDTKPKNITHEMVATRLTKLHRSILRILVPITVVSTILYLEMFFSNIHTTNAELFIQRSIEIVSPYIADKERLQLRSQFRAIETAADFYKLENGLRVIAKQESLTLPAFKSIK